MGERRKIRELSKGCKDFRAPLPLPIQTLQSRTCSRGDILNSKTSFSPFPGKTQLECRSTFYKLQVSSYWTLIRYVVINIELLNTDQIHGYKYRATGLLSNTLLQISSYWTPNSSVVTNRQSPQFTWPVTLQCIQHFSLLKFSWQLIKPTAWFCTLHGPRPASFLSVRLPPNPSLNARHTNHSNYMDCY